MISMNNKIRARFVSAYRLPYRIGCPFVNRPYRFGLQLNFQCSVLALGEVREILMDYIDRVTDY